jgi:hypothetical protein
MADNDRKMVLWGFMPCRIINNKFIQKLRRHLRIYLPHCTVQKPWNLETATNKHKELSSIWSRNFWAADFERASCPTESRLKSRLTTDKTRSTHLSCGHIQVGFRCPCLSMTLVIYWTEYLRCHLNHPVHKLCTVVSWWTCTQLDRNKCGGGIGRWDSISGTVFDPSNTRTYLVHRRAFSVEL